MTGYFFMQKLSTVLMRMWKIFLKITGLKHLFFRKSSNAHTTNDPMQLEISIESTREDLFVERIRIEKMKLSIFNFLSKVTIQEPTFERIIVVYRRRHGKKEGERNIYVKHFKNIPMADMEIVLPEKNNPGLTPVDWVKFFVSAVIGMVAVIQSFRHPQTDIRVILAILGTVLGYCFKTYSTFQSNLVKYQSLITQSVYEKQLDSGRGTLLHLCDEVIQQEVKEVIISFFMLMVQGKASRQELDQRCEELLVEEFDERCNFDVDDALQKLEKLGIVYQDTVGNYTCTDLERANDIIGTTTEEVVLKANEGNVQGRKG